jgi:hypothetical protein
MPRHARGICGNHADNGVTKMKYRIAQNLYANKGFYWRPDDDLSWCPADVFATESEARADLKRYLAEAIMSDTESRHAR